MRLRRRTKVRLDPEMHLELPAFEPDAAAPGEVGWLGDLGNLEEPGVERARFLFLAAGHRELDVVDLENRHVRRLSPRLSPPRQEAS